MVAERTPQITQDRREAAQTDLRVFEVDNLREIQTNYHQFAEAVKPILKQGAAKLVEYGVFPEEQVAGGKTMQIIDVNYEAESSLSKVVVDTNGTMFICDQVRVPGDLDFVIDWDSKKEAADEDYVDFSLVALKHMADQLREGLGMDTQSNPIPFHSRW